MSKSELMKRLYQAHFASFVRLAFREVEPHVVLRDNWHIDVLADALGRTLSVPSASGPMRLVVNAPPRSLLAHCAAVALPVFALGRDSHRTIRVVAASRDRARDLRERAVALMQAPRCRWVFPHLVPREGRHAIAVPHGGTLTYAVVGRPLHGGGADLTIVDTPLLPDQAQDEGARRAVIGWFDAEIAPRLAGGGGGAAVLATRRLHRQDLTAHVAARGWTRVSLSAMAKADEAWPLALGGIIRRRNGEPLQAALEDRAALRARLIDVGAVDFAAQYLQEPLAQTSGVRAGHFSEPRPPDWTPEMGVPKGFFGRISEVRYLLHELFGEAKPPQLQTESALSLDEWQQACMLQQRRLIAEVEPG